MSCLFLLIILLILLAGPVIAFSIFLFFIGLMFELIPILIGILVVMLIFQFISSFLN